MKISKVFLTSIVLLAVFVVVTGARRIVAQRSFHAVKAGAANKPGLKSKGSLSAPVKIVEFTDFQCPACAKAVETVEEILAQYPGKIYFEMKHFPLGMHPYAFRAAVYSQCAAEQGKFWPFYEVLFKSQRSWHKMPSVDTYFSELAVSLGLDGVALSACVNNAKAAEAVEKDRNDGEAVGVVSTPTFLVNGGMYVGVTAFVDKMEKVLGIGKE